jgi:hypothetical protein
MRIIAILVIVTFGLALTTLLVRFPNYWPVSAFPLVTLVVFQGIALSGWSGTHRLFSITDYLYYALIGGVVGVGSIYVLNGGAAERLNLLLEHEALSRELAVIENNLPDLAKVLEQPAPIPPTAEEWTSCMDAQLQERLRTPSSSSAGSKLPTLRIDVCRGYFEALAQREARQRDYARLVARRDTIRHRLPGLETEIADRSQVRLVGQTYDELLLQLLVVPTLILIGVTMKLGKTTKAFSN